MLSIDVMDSYGFLVWTTLSRGWAFVAATFIILVPLIQEVYAIWRQHNLNQQQSQQPQSPSSGSERSKRGTILL